MSKYPETLQVEFLKSSSKFSQCPVEDTPEFAFIGRSNVGKSSLINFLCGRKNIAKTSATPGKTQLINHFKIQDQFFFVDLPGYGYAKVSKGQKRKFQTLITEYVERSEKLVCLFVLIDSRHSPQAIDLEFLEYLGVKEIPFAIIFTKTDKLSKNQFVKNLKVFENTLLKTWEYLPEIFASSAQKKTGREEILSFIHQCMT